ncbi:glycoside hydrolase family 5 protein [Serpula lacrymans var. lacrymans S7.3]|uniref:Glycoside hydrolase family 5 protein n=2 Tax=Serpula lacrymans var. lacrymans TaxID=341189 RepID=F8Q4F7_SERL3|nr:glycoside hydrolase family 5 protein [Serpula lacrymans var. lacrymans S7.9]EGN97012.1 glycoside hydrolase family 5 protein [Serpula lacrymans var. lacrymans S7.3]EGO22603.1 glycoside hydrolase family 5 protein [Serpula lacrymans var. lacrymans S7.9]
MKLLLTSLSFLLLAVSQTWAAMPSKIYGVNLGSWLVLESWMLPQGWLDMGGQSCSDCSTCIATESSFAKAYPDTVNEKFAQHWDTWFTQDDVNQLKAAGINTVRVPLGYWIVEALVDWPIETYPQGGLTYLRRGLSWLQDAGITAILDHHALPGVQTPNQQFTGNCTTDIQFYTPYNYHRALVWTAVMATLSHLDPNFGSVAAIEAVNEPIMDANETPDYGYFQKYFVETVRAVELMLGISVPSMSLNVSVSSSNVTAAMIEVSSYSIFSPEVQSALAAAAPILLDIGSQFSMETIFDFNLTSAPLYNSREPLITNFMDVNWQYDNPPNPAYAAIGPQGYDNHLYYSSGVADPNPTAYLESVCNLNRIQADAALGDTPLWFGEWGLPTQFNATDEFLYQWADAQKWAYSKGAGWIFWNFKTEISELAAGLARQWSYLEGLKLGFFTMDPSQYNNASVCDAYINSTST